MSKRIHGSSSFSQSSGGKWRTDFKDFNDSKALPMSLDLEVEDGSAPSSSVEESAPRELTTFSREQSQSFILDESLDDQENMCQIFRDENLLSSSSESASGNLEDPRTIYKLDSVVSPLHPSYSSEGSNSPEREEITSKHATLKRQVGVKNVESSSSDSNSPLGSSPIVEHPLSKIDIKKKAVHQPELDLFHEEKPVQDLEMSLDLFVDTKKPLVSKSVVPPRPPKPKVVEEPTTEDKWALHPLMSAVEPEPESELSFSYSVKDDVVESKNNLSLRVNNFMKKRGRSPSRRSENDTKDKASTENLDSRSETGSADNSSTKGENRKQKFKVFKSNLQGKLYNKANAYYDWYYTKGKGNQKDDQSEANQKETDQASPEGTPSESSEDSFFEITADDVAVIPLQNSDAEDGDDSIRTSTDDIPFVTEGERRVASPAQPSVVTPPLLHMALGDSFINMILSCRESAYFLHILVTISSFLAFVVLFFCSEFVQGCVVGALVPVSLWTVLKVVTRSSRAEFAVVNEHAAKQCSRLRALGSKSTLKDFFQYTETKPFGDLRLKNLPFRYFKLKGSVMECFELNATKEQVANPLVLSHEEVKVFGLKPIFKVDISGWEVSIECPPGYKVTASNKWKRKYPIWLRQVDWRTSNDQYQTENSVNSFYLISSFSRYKEQWYEALRKASNPPPDRQGEREEESYHEYMSRLFDRIPNVGSHADNEEEEPDNQEIQKEVAWVNALFGRMVWNILNDIKWEERITDRIVRKLASVNTPRIRSIELESFDLGDSMPLITKTYLPRIDHQGVWSELEMEWSGEVSLSLVARINAKTTGSSQPTETNKNIDEMRLESEEPAPSSAKLSSKFSRWLERLDIGVTAKVTRVVGRLCVNIPPPPTDCIWYGFKEPPELKIHLTPIIGKWISLEYPVITNALEKQLKILFNETFVLPAMENIVIPGMSREIVTRHEALDLKILGEGQELLDVADRGS